MDLVTVRELYKNRKSSWTRKLPLADGSAAFGILKHSVSSLSVTELILRPFRLFTMTLWKTSHRFPN